MMTSNNYCGQRLLRPQLCRYVNMKPQEISFLLLNCVGGVLVNQFQDHTIPTRVPTYSFSHSNIRVSVVRTIVLICGINGLSVLDDEERSKLSCCFDGRKSQAKRLCLSIRSWLLRPLYVKSCAAIVHTAPTSSLRRYCCRAEAA